MYLTAIYNQLRLWFVGDRKRVKFPPKKKTLQDIREWKYANQINFKVSVVTTDATALMANHPEQSLYIWDNTLN
jgi:hypothetical protein